MLRFCLIIGLCALQLFSGSSLASTESDNTEKKVIAVKEPKRLLFADMSIPQKRQACINFRDLLDNIRNKLSSALSNYRDGIPSPPEQIKTLHEQLVKQLAIFKSTDMLNQCYTPSAISPESEYARTSEYNLYALLYLKRKLLVWYTDEDLPRLHTESEQTFYQILEMFAFTLLDFGIELPNFATLLQFWVPQKLEPLFLLLKKRPEQQENFLTAFRHIHKIPIDNLNRCERQQAIAKQLKKQQSTLSAIDPAFYAAAKKVNQQYIDDCCSKQKQCPLMKKNAIEAAAEKENNLFDHISNPFPESEEDHYH